MTSKLMGEWGLALRALARRPAFGVATVSALALGIACGLAGAVALSGVMRGLLHEVSPTDPGTLAAVAAGLALVALLACLMPGWRAASVDPARVLRQE